jgi:hypothetical protein
MFSKVLKAAAEQEPDRVANFAVKALHDKLNRDGVQVRNDAGDTWTLTGDGRLTDKTLAIMRKAVHQSIDNVTNDPSIRQTNLNHGPYFTKVWRYVPQLTGPSSTNIIVLAKVFLTPASEELATAAADIITEQTDLLIETLIDEGKLKRA